MLNVIMNTQQLDQFAGVFGVILNTHEETTFFPMERFAEKKSSFEQTEEHAYIFELVAYVEIKGEIARVDFSINTDFNFPDDERHKLESLLKEDILRVIGVDASRSEMIVDLYSEEEINTYLDKHFFFWADAEESYRFDPHYWKEDKKIGFEFRNTHYTNPKMMLNISINETEEMVSIRTDDLEGTLEKMTEWFCGKGLPMETDEIYSELLEFGLNVKGARLISASSLSDDYKLKALESVLHVKLTTQGLDHKKPNAKMVGGFAFKYADGRTFQFDYEHATVLEGFEMDGSYEMSFRLCGLHKDFIKESNDHIPMTWHEVFEGEIVEVAYEVLDEFDLPVKCEVELFNLIDPMGEWHTVPFEALKKYNEEQLESTK